MERSLLIFLAKRLRESNPISGQDSRCGVKVITEKDLAKRAADVSRLPRAVRLLLLFRSLVVLTSFWKNIPWNIWKLTHDCTNRYRLHVKRVKIIHGIGRNCFEIVYI